MNKTGTEYVRGIPVVKVFQQTIYSFKVFHDAIVDYARMAQDYAGTFCRTPQVANLTALNGLAAFFLPVALLLAPGRGRTFGPIRGQLRVLLRSSRRWCPTAMTQA